MPRDGSGRYACITVDLDTLRCYRDIHGLDYEMVGRAGDPTYTVGVQRMLEMFDDLGIRATLFVIGRDTVVPTHHDLLKRAHDAGHELANHTHSHHYDLPRHPRTDQQSEVARGEGAIASITGTGPAGFRAPGYNMTGELLDICRSRDYLYDSSILPSPPYWLAKGAIMTWKRMMGAPSRSSQTPASNLLAPTTAYRPAPDALWRHDPDGDSPIEVPMCLVPGLRIPVIGTSLHLLGASGFAAIYPLLRRHYDSILNLEFHAIDFIDDSDLADPGLAEYQPDLEIPWIRKRQRYRNIFERIGEDYTFATMADAVGAIPASRFT